MLSLLHLSNKPSSLDILSDRRPASYMLASPTLRCTVLRCNYLFVDIIIIPILGKITRYKENIKSHRYKFNWRLYKFQDYLHPDFYTSHAKPHLSKSNISCLSCSSSIRESLKSFIFFCFSICILSVNLATNTSFFLNYLTNFF